VGRISGRAYGTVVNLVRDASQKAQMIHNASVQQVKTITINAYELSSFSQKKTKTLFAWELEVSDCWIGLSQAKHSGLILAALYGSTQTN
jgi:hypothetical protein